MAGYLTADEAISIAYYRGLTVSEISSKGAMMAVGLGRERAAELISSLALQDRIGVACVNSIDSTTVSGDSDAIDGFLPILQSQRIFARKLKTDGKAYHSHFMNSIAQKYEDLLHPIFSTKTPTHGISSVASRYFEKVHVEMFSSTTTQHADEAVVNSAGYWRKNLESPVLFSDALEKLLLSEPYHLIEIGPHPTLGQPIRDTQKKLQFEASKMIYTSTLSRGKDTEKSILDLAGDLYLRGHALPFNKINNPSLKSEKFIGPSLRGRVLHSLPAYPWQYDSPLWNESRISSEFRNRKNQHHDLLGSRILGSPGKSTSRRNVIKTTEISWLKDHRLGQTIVFPPAGYLGMAIDGLRQVHELGYSLHSSILFSQVHLINVLILPDNKDGIEVFMTVEPEKISSTTSSEIWWWSEVSSNDAGRSTVHESSLISLNIKPSALSQRFRYLEEIMEHQSTRTWYDQLAKEGFYFGPTFKSLTEIHSHRGRTISQTISRTTLLRGGGDGHDQQSQYFIHLFQSTLYCKPQLSPPPQVSFNICVVKSLYQPVG